MTKKEADFIGSMNMCDEISNEAYKKIMCNCETEEPKTYVLDKIRAEIENHCGLAKENYCRYCSYCNSLMGVREILAIIDKYKAESEDKE